MIELNNITKKYGEVPALNKITLKVLKGEFFSIIGPNGSGKTTLLKTMAGIENPTSGTMIFDGKKVDQGNLAEIRRRTTMVFQTTALFNTTVYRNIAYGLKLRGFSHKEIKERIKKTLNVVRLQNYEERLAKSLSGGEQQRVALARALALGTEVLLLDEPTANLDPKSVSIIEETISWIKQEQKTTIIMATHNMFQAESLSERTAFLIGGKIHLIGRSRELFRLPSLTDFARVENIFSGEAIILKEGTAIVKLENGVNIETAIGYEGRVTLFIRPEDIILSKERIMSSARNVFNGKITGITDLGTLVKIRVDVGLEFSVQITKRSFVEMQFNIGSYVFLTFKAGSVHVI